MEYRSWAHAAGIRAVKTFGQTLGGALTATYLIQDVDWTVVLGAAAIATALSLCMSLAGLPEAKR